MGWDLSLDVLLPYVWEVLEPFAGIMQALGILLIAGAGIGILRKAFLG